ncbi:MAG: AMP-binding protein, partial [bacterium]|nr:AMP-binding protein [bacterium]
MSEKIEVRCKTLIEALEARKGSLSGVTFVSAFDREKLVPYKELYDRALNLLHGLQESGVRRGDEIIILIGENYDFLSTFWACLLGGIVPVPLALRGSDEHRLKIFTVWKTLSNPYLLTFRKNSHSLECFVQKKHLMDVYAAIEEKLLIFEELEQEGGKGEPICPKPEDIAYIQFSSGSTGRPKGVVLTHDNLITNIYAMVKAIESPGDFERFFSWMPLTHDMGLIAFHLMPLVKDWPHYIMPTELFIRRPLLWMKKISQHKLTLTASPNFGYQYFLKFFKAQNNKDMDLSSLRLIVNGAEPISVKVCRRFLDTMAPFGLHPATIFPVYGLAEASLAVSASGPKDVVTAVYLDRNALPVGGKITETGTTDSDDSIAVVDVGTPLDDCMIKIVGNEDKDLPAETIGNIVLKGKSITSGYYNNPDATNQAITADGWLHTGDLGFFKNNHLFITGRSKEIIFVNGQNFYPHDLENEVENIQGFGMLEVVFTGVTNPDTQLEEVLCFIRSKTKPKDLPDLTTKVKRLISLKMEVEVHKIIPIRKIPKTTSGKKQRIKLGRMYLQGEYDTQLAELNRLTTETKKSPHFVPENDIERKIVDACVEILGVESVCPTESFFDIGVNSLNLARIKGHIRQILDVDINEVTLFKYPTIRALSQHLAGRLETNAIASDSKGGEQRRETVPQGTSTEIAVVGMAGRFPGAPNIDVFWDNLIKGRETISFFSAEELEKAGIPRHILDNPDYIKAKGLLGNSEYFDPSFFGFTAKEAEMLDPQVRILHECVWEALENAGYAPGTYDGSIGLYAGATPNFYWELLFFDSENQAASNQFVTTQLVDKDFLATRISYSLDLKGPAVSIYTACSTSLVAINMACRDLNGFKCDMALAGGVSLRLPEKTGYLYEENMLFSRDGHNSSFSDEASGTVFSDGAGIVALKRLDEAVADGDNIYAVIKGSAVNNDGREKMSYTAPGIPGQRRVVAGALAAAKVPVESITYLEAHGSATKLGDSIEIQALKEAFNTDKKNFCSIGSVKANIGHLNAASGVAGFIKTALALKYKALPPHIHSQKTNPTLDLENSPFYIDTQLKAWCNDRHPLRAGVSSFGIGGTNAHVILEEPPMAGSTIPVVPPREYSLILLSAASPSALEKLSATMANYLKEAGGVK